MVRNLGHPAGRRTVLQKEFIVTEASILQPAPSSPSPAGTNSRRLAIASIICGALGIVTCGVSAVLGLILGIIALTRCGQGTAPGRSRGLAGR